MTLVNMYLNGTASGRKLQLLVTNLLFRADLFHIRLLPLIVVERSCSGIMSTLSFIHYAGDEFCIAETFEAACGHNEVIVIDAAIYGRMRIGRCVDNDYGYLGCNNDVTGILDDRCSGKQTCSFLIDKTLWRESDSSCAKPITGYAEIEYSCQAG